MLTLTGHKVSIGRDSMARSQTVTCLGSLPGGLQTGFLSPPASHVCFVWLLSRNARTHPHKGRTPPMSVFARSLVDLGKPLNVCKDCYRYFILSLHRPDGGDHTPLFFGCLLIAFVVSDTKRCP